MALYHKYRPLDFGTIIGQHHIVETIQNQVKNGTTAHAYLFAGPRGVGKTTTARILAKALNCPKRDGSDIEPDLTSSCAIEIGESRSIDVIEIDAASHTGVDHVREHIIENAQFQPTSLPYKVFIIDEVHMLSNSAFNALLKTLEEPPKHAVFILATTELHKLPDTIVSRCQVFNFKRIPHDVLSKHIENIASEEKVKIDTDVVDRIVNKSDGCARDAVSLLDQILATGESHITAKIASLTLPTSSAAEILSFIAALIKKDAAAALDGINTLIENGANISQFAHDAIEMLRIIMITKISGSQTGLGLDLTTEAKQQIEALGNEISHPDVIALIDLLLKRKTEIKTAPIPQLPLEIAVVAWCHASDASVQTPPSAPVKVEAPIAKPEPKQTEPVVKEIVEEKKEEPAIEPPQEEVPPPVEEITPEPPQETPKATGSLTKAMVEAKWSDFISAIEQVSPSLVFILKMVEIQDVSGDVIKIAVQYKFHHDKLTATQVRPKIEQAFSDVLGTPIRTEVIVVEKSADAQQEDADLTDLTAAFGGEVVG